MRERILLAWSGGKDSALALDEIRRGEEFEVAALLTTITEGEDRVGMHRVPRRLIERQAEAVGLALEAVRIPEWPSNEVYDERMRRALKMHLDRGIRRVAFGDLFLEDIRRYREERLARAGMEGIFPLWKRDTRGLAEHFVAAGFQAVVVCADTAAIDASFAGRSFDRGFLSSLPPAVDPCGENGEFHTFVFDGPPFRRPVRCAPGKITMVNRFAYCDLIDLNAPED